VFGSIDNDAAAPTAIVTCTLADLPSDDAMIVAVPGIPPVIVPSEATRTTCSSLDAKRNDRPVTTFPAESFAMTVSFVGSPAGMGPPNGVIVIVEIGTFVTTIVVLPLAAPDVATIVAVPGATAITFPFKSTVATLGSLEIQATDAPDTIAPLSSTGTAVTRRVSPTLMLIRGAVI